MLKTNVIKEWEDGKHIQLYIPSSVQSKIFTPDISSFRTSEEVARTDVGRGFWESLLDRFGLDVNESESYHRDLESVISTSRNNIIGPTAKNKAALILSVIQAGATSNDLKDKVYDSIATEYLSVNNIKDKDVRAYIKSRKPSSDLTMPAIPNDTSSAATPSYIGLTIGQAELKRQKDRMYNAAYSDYKDGGSGSVLSYYIEQETDKIAKRKQIKFTDDNKRSNSEWMAIKAKVEEELVMAFNVSLYERFFSNADVIGLLESAQARQGSFSFREWDVPMMKLDLDPNAVIVNAVTVSLANNLAKMQIQMEDEPTYQHIGAKDSFVSMSLTIFGEKELRKIKNMFDFLSGLARLEHAAGVIGFMGIKNIITALAGIKYVLPLSYNVNTIPNYPHVYQVELSLVDFDVFQQKREMISNEQQKKFIEQFKSKRNPFLRLKQNWGVFNAYPDLPLQVKDSLGETVGTLDPDFYFRSFETFDQDLINTTIDRDEFHIPIKSDLDSIQLTEADKAIADTIKQNLLLSNGSIQEAKKYLIDDLKMEPAKAMMVFRKAIFDTDNDTIIEQIGLNKSRNVANKFPDIWKDFIDTFVDELGVEHTFADLKFTTEYGELKIGDLVTGSKEQIKAFNSLVMESEYSLKEGKLPSFDPDEVPYGGVIYYIPSADSADLGKIPCIYQTPDGGFLLGYSSEEDGRFYIALDNLNVVPDADGNAVLLGATTTPVSDTSTPERDKQEVHTQVAGATSLDSYQRAYGTNTKDEMQSVNSSGGYKEALKHWEKMMMDTQYRDKSYRMIRAFPTYMLWLIDESYFSGTKLFDNFYGLQSVIDFSIVQSEDILGDTLILRLSNTYSKLSKPELTVSDLVSAGNANGVVTDITAGSAALIDTLLNVSRNFATHFHSKYVTEIENMRLKPGVRVHLRAGYGSNPNSLDTVFNGIITQVELGEIVTVTCQSDAIELSPIINSSNKKGDSGKIDGGINTGMWLSEPRDLMIRLLSMGSSRVREAFAHATRGSVFSENKFGIRHFGSILYEPLTEREKIQASQYRNVVADAFNVMSNNPFTGTAGVVGNSFANMASLGGFESAGGSMRTPVFGMMQMMMTSFSTQRDMEIFKRNIYPGNGLGISQFMGGDIDDGWSVLASVDPSEIENQKFGYLDRLSDSSWNRLIQASEREMNAGASSVLGSVTASSKLVDSSKAIGTSQVLGGLAIAALAAPVGAIAAPAGITASIVGGVGAAAGGGGLGSILTKNLAGRGTANLFKTMGLVSDLDDDIYDEVSFRAQTYMRSVWDMFQLCARLLPNYIVAVRPFEDRSTVFYGKPHWLYTSGVYPISTGFHIESADSDVDGPVWSGPDYVMNEILNKINKESSPLADSNAFSDLSESKLSGMMSIFGENTLKFQDIFKAGEPLNGQIINFGDVDRNKYYVDGELKSVLPVNKGKVQVGFHLPFGVAGGIEAPIQNDHKQADFLPMRFRYPFFTNRSSGTLNSLDFDKILKLNSQEDVEQRIANIVEISKFEKDLVSKEGSETKLVSTNTSGEKVLNFNFPFGQYLAASQFADGLANEAAFDPSGFSIAEGSSVSSLAKVASQTIQMPLPIVNKATFNDDLVNVDGKFEFIDGLKDVYGDVDNAFNLQLANPSLPLNFTEWSTPIDADHEQFYIAMRWPYNPLETRTNPDEYSQDEQVRNKVLEEFKKQYNFTNQELVGSADDYKKRKVLVYNPDSKQAVVCAPAYFLWSDSDPNGSNKTEAIVSPDAALFLGLLINEDGEILSPTENLPDVYDESGVLADSWETIGMSEASLKECHFTFVHDDVPLGVVTSAFNPAKQFYSSQAGETYESETFAIGFGNFVVKNNFDITDEESTRARRTDVSYKYAENPFKDKSKFTGLKSNTLIPNENLSSAEAIIITQDQKAYLASLSSGGNYRYYFDNIRSNELDKLKEQTLIDLLDSQDGIDTGEKLIGSSEDFKAVFDPSDTVSVTARGFYDESFDAQTKVIAGNGRSVGQAQWIWNQFRVGYHTYESVKNIFAEIYGLDPDEDDAASSHPLIAFLSGSQTTGLIKEFEEDKVWSNEFNSLLGADWIGNNVDSQAASKNQALYKAAEQYLDSGVSGKNEEGVTIDENDGVIDYFNNLIKERATFIRDAVKSNAQLLSSVSSTGAASTTATSADGTEFLTDDQKADEFFKNIKTPKQLFLLLVGLFRDQLWRDPYSRAWVVLKPDRKRFVMGDDEQMSDSWSFRPFDKIWQAYIDYNGTYGKDASKFKKLLEANSGEGNAATNWMSGMWEDTTNFWNKNIGPMFTVFQSAIGNLLNLTKMSLAQMGYGVTEHDNFAKQANVLNKAYNDSLYYSLGRPGSLLRAVDNPFTREYGEPVVEIREPFQRIHLINSFNHILANGIQENIGGVATQITAVSDGQYPVTVALDKAAPPERQVEKTIETGLYFDNIRGSGFWGVLHPIFNPIETIRGISKFASGEPDELTARRVGLAHLKESIKDIYSGEITLIGDTSIRPHDLVYLTDSYERIYGIFEVEQVVHHFTPEMGFVTSITPNAFVNVNDPARWFASSWIGSRMNHQSVRDLARRMLSSETANSLIGADGTISIDNLAQSLGPQMTGGMMYTHGHSALVKDIIANTAADAIPDKAEQIKAKIKASTGKQDGDLGGAISMVVGSMALTAATTAASALFAPFTLGTSLAVGFSAGAIASDLLWSGWKWTRDNVLDQHGCYVQYLNRNGQPMDAGLSFNQGMVVGRAHSKKLIPQILGVRTAVRTEEGYSYVRSDDIFRSLGWKEKEINDLVRHVSLENAIVNAQILKYSGIGPEKTGFNQFFKVIGTVSHVVDGDTFDVVDVITNKTFRVRFEGVNTAELAQLNINTALEETLILEESQKFFNPLSAAGQALLFTADAVVGKMVVLRIAVSPDNRDILSAEDLEAGAEANDPERYQKAAKSGRWQSDSDRYMATIFYRTDSNVQAGAIEDVRNIFIKNVSSSDMAEKAKQEIKKRFYPRSPIEANFDKIFNKINSMSSLTNYFFDSGPSDPLYGMSDSNKRAFSTLVAMLILYKIYGVASEWPMVGWDEYYPDGTPYTLNWDLVEKGLAKVYTKGLLYVDSPAVQDPSKLVPTITKVL